jgi:FkbM family methyltransferase
MKNKITFSNSIIKSESNLVDKAKKFFYERGALFLIRKALSFLALAIKRFFVEYLPLKVMYYFSINGEIKKKVQGSDMYLNLNDTGISRELAVYGVHEHNSTEEVKRVIKPGMKILEVGANIGYYALLETKLAGSGGHLYAMEPSPFNFDLLSRNLELNKLSNFDLYRTAAGSINGKARFLLSGKSNLSSFIERDDLSGEVTEVDVIKLDDFLKDKNVDFIRMDVEGFEGEILNGAKNILSSVNKPKLFFIEVHSDLLLKKGSSCSEIVNFLFSYGYEIRKSFWRGRSDICVSSVSEILSHPKLEVGYWETFFELK